MRESGHTLIELCMVLAILGALAGVGLPALDLAGPSFALLPVELHGALDHGFHLARARGREVRVALAGGPGGEVPPVILPRGIRWGLPSSGVPRPPGMKPTVKAHLTGAAHPVVTLTPRGTATAGCWFLSSRREALCVRLSGQGDLKVLRWRSRLRAWTPA